VVSRATVCLAVLKLRVSLELDLRTSVGFYGHALSRGGRRLPLVRLCLATAVVVPPARRVASTRQGAGACGPQPVVSGGGGR
jgi:hypothetical protein